VCVESNGRSRPWLWYRFDVLVLIVLQCFKGWAYLRQWLCKAVCCCVRLSAIDRLDTDTDPVLAIAELHSNYSSNSHQHAWLCEYSKCTCYRQMWTTSPVDLHPAL
jgi:hypothetical protein